MFHASSRLLRSTALAAVLASAALPAFADECLLKEFASLPVDYASGKPITLDVVIDDQPAKLTVDTGAGRSYLNQNFVERLQLSEHDTRAIGHGLTGKPIDKYVLVDRLTFGQAVISNEKFGVSNMAGDGSDQRPAGLFGAGYLANFDVELDPTAGKINLFQPNQCPGKVVYWAKEYFRLPVHLTDRKQMEVQITVDGKPVRAMIDTGSGADIMRLVTASDRFGIEAPDSTGGRRLKLRSIDGVQIPAFQHVFSTLTFGGITLHDTKVTIADFDSGRGIEHTGTRIDGWPEQPEMLIGRSLLRRLHLFIAYSESAIYFTVADPAPAGAE